MKTEDLKELDNFLMLDSKMEFHSICYGFKKQFLLSQCFLLKKSFEQKKKKNNRSEPILQKNQQQHEQWS